METNLYICSANNSFGRVLDYKKRFRAYPCITSDSFSRGLLAQLGGTPSLYILINFCNTYANNQQKRNRGE